MSAEPLQLQGKLREEYLARWDAVEVAKAKELAALTEERASETIQSLQAAESWRPRPDWSGLVERQGISPPRRQ